MSFIVETRMMDRHDIQVLVDHIDVLLHNAQVDGMNEERARSARLIKALREISPWQDGAHSIDDIVAMAITEYESTSK